MPLLVVTALAPIGAWIQLRRERDAGHARRLEVYLVWWLAVAIGAESLIGALFHLFDGPMVAEEIGYTRGDGGFQYENAMGDLAIGVTGLLCTRIRGNFWLAVLIVTSIVYYGDAGGHVYFWLAEDDTDPGNVGAPLWLDVIVPTVAWLLYWRHRRAQSQQAHR